MALRCTLSPIVCSTRLSSRADVVISRFKLTGDERPVMMLRHILVTGAAQALPELRLTQYLEHALCKIRRSIGDEQLCSGANGKGGYGLRTGNHGSGGGQRFEHLILYTRPIRNRGYGDRRLLQIGP